MDYKILLGFVIGIVGFILYFCSLGPVYLVRIFKKKSQVAQIFFRTSGEIFLFVGIVWIVLSDHQLLINAESIFGALIFILSIVISLVSVHDLGITSVYMALDDKLTTKGIYKKVRHPQALARILTSFGLAMMLNSFWLLVFSVLIVFPGFVIDTYIEDRELRLRFGQSFNEYERRVARFLPHIW